MKRVFFLLFLFLFLLYSPAFSQVRDLEVKTSATLFSCKDDVCAVKVVMTVSSPFFFTTSCVIEYSFVDKNGQIISSFQTEVFTLQGNEARTLEKLVLMDRARLETVKEIRANLKYFTPPVKRGYGWNYGPRYICPRSF